MSTPKIPKPSARRFLLSNGRYGYRPGRPVSDATHITDGGRDIAADPPEVVAKIAAATSMCDEPECDSAAIATYAESAHTRNTLRHHREVLTAQEERKSLSVEQRLATVEERAKHQRVDVAQDVFVIRTAQKRAAKGGRRLPLRVVARLEKVEARLDGVTDLPIQRAS